MELTLATRDGREIGVIPYDVDMEAGGNNTFEIEVPRAACSGEIDYGMRVFVLGTEFGGIVGEIQTMNDPEMVYYRGYLWRGLLKKKIIVPPSGQDYYMISGELNSCIRQLISSVYNDSLMRGCGESTGVSVSGLQFDRYTDLLSGITKMLASVGYRISIKYVEEGTGGFVEIGAVPVVNYSAKIEFSEDDEVKFVVDDARNGVNHLICLGQGDLAARTVVHLYADASGNISETQTFFGRDEIAETFDYPSAADSAELINSGKERFAEVLSRKRFDASAGRIETDLQIGDVISGRDYVTGINIVKPIERKILQIVGEIETIEYRLEGET